MKQKNLIFAVTSIFIVATAIAVAIYFAINNLEKLFFKPTATKTESGVSTGDTELVEPIDIVAENLSVPWDIAFLPDGDLLVTERAGVLRRIGKTNNSYKIQNVSHTGEGGLLGLALHPNFSENKYLYLYLTYSQFGTLLNRVERYTYTEEEELTSRTTIIDKIPGSRFHNGGRMAFGPGNYLYITTGDAQNTSLAQDINSLAGKILRVRDDGSVPPDNPFGNEVWSYGHRNPQGLAWDNSGKLWATEHGPSANDELNLIEKGANYGWPAITGNQTADGMKAPVINSGTSETWAPAGLAYLEGGLFFAGLRGQSLYEAVIKNGNVSTPLISHFRQEYGRLRAIITGPDGYLYISTSNKDGRGSIQKGDDKIIKVHPDIFRQ